jgi:hypothetical protein
MKYILSFVLSVATAFQSSAQVGTAWFCRVDSLGNGHVKVRWRAIIPASSGLKPSAGAKCRLTLEGNSDLARGRQPLFYPDYRVFSAPGLPGFVLEITQSFERIKGSPGRNALHGTMSYQCSRNGGPPTSCEQRVAFDIH